MGKILDSRLRAPGAVAIEGGPRAEEARRIDGAPRHVGWMPDRHKCSATVIENWNGVWCYSPTELTIYVWPLKYHEIPLGRFTGMDRESLLWAGMEVKLEKTAENNCWNGKHLIAALTKPASQNWFGFAAFRPPLHRGRAKILEGLREALRRETLRRETERETVSSDRAANKVAIVWGESALPEALRKLPNDPFETDKDWLTARFPDPMRFRWADVEAVGDDYSVARNPNYRNGPKPPGSQAKQSSGSPQWSFGVCAAMEEAHADIRIQALSDKRLLEMPRRPGGPHSAALDAIDGLLDAAIWQALAGRPGGDRRVPVVRWVIRYVHDLLESATKRFEGKPRAKN